jgi:hypothetical protein
MNLYTEEKKLVEDLDRWSKETTDYAIYTHLFLTNKDIVNVMNSTKEDEFAKREFLACLFHWAVKPDDIQFLEFNKLFHPEIIYVADTYDQSTVAITSYKDVYNKLNPSNSLFIIKTNGNNGDPNMLMHEAFVGLYGTNILSKKVPNFMYVYDIISNCNVYYDNHLCFTNGDRSYLIAEKVKGIQLYEFMKKPESTRPVLFSIFMQILNALYIAKEECNFIHGDLHTKNIIIETLDNEIHIPFYLESDNPKSYITTKYVARMIDFELSNIEYNKKFYNGLDDRFKTPRAITSVTDLFKLLLDLVLLNQKYLDMWVVLIDAYVKTVNDTKHFYAYMEDRIKNVQDRYIPYNSLHNTTLKKNINFSLRDYYTYLIDVYPEIFSKTLIKEKKSIQFIYNKNNNKNKNADISRSYVTSSVINSTWIGIYRALYYIKNKTLQEKATKDILEYITVDKVSKEIKTATKLFSEAKKVDVTKIQTEYNKLLSIASLDAKKQYVNKIVQSLKVTINMLVHYLDSYIKLLNILSILELLKEKDYDLSDFDELENKISALLKKEKKANIASSFKNMYAIPPNIRGYTYYFTPAKPVFLNMDAIVKSIEDVSNYF